MRPIIVWIRRDLRVSDHPSLFHASQSHRYLVPVFIFDTELIRSLPSDGAAFEFQAEALRELRESIRKLGGELILRKGRPLDIHRELIAATNPSALYYNRDYEPRARERDGLVEKLYRSRGIETKSFRDIVHHEPDEVLTSTGKPFSVFTPYARAWRKLPLERPVGMPRRFSTPNLPSDPIIGAGDLKRKITLPQPLCSGGEKIARRQWREFARKKLRHYATRRNFPGEDGTSRLSPYLRFGCISVRSITDEYREMAVAQRENPTPDISAFETELIWREFYQSILYHFPHLVTSNYRTEFDRMPWKFNPRLFRAWKTGMTGYPIVDAGMRQLLQTGWMHNRVRMIVSSFLTKDLRHDWRLGASWFEEKLLDIETASNNGGWQWAASTGVDPRPLRLFNPQRQSERFDAEGIYIRRFVPELRQVPARYIHAPHLMPHVLQKSVGCIIGRNYPAPIVDHADAVKEYRIVYAELRNAQRIFP